MDVLSRKGYLSFLKSKSSTVVAQAFRRIMDDSAETPSYVITDRLVHETTIHRRMRTCRQRYGIYGFGVSGPFGGKINRSNPHEPAAQDRTRVSLAIESSRRRCVSFLKQGRRNRDSEERRGTTTRLASSGQKLARADQVCSAAL